MTKASASNVRNKKASTNATTTDSIVSRIVRCAWAARATGADARAEARPDLCQTRSLGLLAMSEREIAGGWTSGVRPARTAEAARAYKRFGGVAGPGHRGPAARGAF